MLNLPTLNYKQASEGSGANRGVTRKSEQRGEVATGCTYSRSQSATMSGNETPIASFPGFVCLGASSRVRCLN